MTRISQPIDLFPSRRILDYDVWLARVWDDAVILCAHGSMYGDAYMKRGIPLEPGLYPLERVRVDTAYHKPGETDPFCGATGPDQDLE
jgi:hypothetical protein